MHARSSLTLLLALVVVAPLRAQEPSAGKLPVEPADTLRLFQLPPTLAIELVAAEPLVVDPVAISFDDQGRMFVVEYRDYPNGPGEGKPPLSRVKLLIDADGDGQMDQSHVFAEGLSFAQGVLAWRGGAIVTAAPDVLFLKDTDGDHRADLREVLFTGFKPGNPQLRTAHPKLGLDNWIYLTNGLSGGEVVRPGSDRKVTLGKLDFRFHSRSLEFEAEAGVAQFGNTFDDFGNRFFCSNRNPVMFAPLPQRALARNPLAAITTIHEDVAPSGGEAKVYPLVEGKTTAMSHAGTHTAACGVHIHRGDDLEGGYHGSVFVCEPTGSLVTRSTIKPAGSSFRAERAEAGRDFLASTDPWFRPVSLADGPDGALYIVDMYREVIEHPQYMPAGLAETLNLRAGDDRGRIYRIRAKLRPREKYIPPKNARERTQLLSSSNGWRRDLGQRLIVETQEADLEELQRLISPNNVNVLSRIHALYALDGLGKLDAATLVAVRKLRLEGGEHAFKLAAGLPQPIGEPFWAEIEEALKHTRPAFHLNAPDRLQLLLLLGGDARPEIAGALADLVDPDDPWQVRALLTGVRERSAQVLGLLAQRKKLAGPPTPGRLELVTGLAAVAGARGENVELAQILDLVSTGEEVAWWQTAALTGLAQGLARRQGAGRTSLGKLLAEPPAVLREAAERAQSLLDRTAKIALASAAEPGDRASAARLLAYQPLAEAEAPLAELLRGTQPLEVQLAAVEALRVGHAAASPTILMARWSSMSPAARSSAVDLLLSRPETVRPFLEAMKLGKVQTAIVPLDRRDQLVKHADPAIKALAVELFGAAISANRKEVAERYAAALADKADPARGHAVFKRICFACHKVAGEGHDVGPDITDVRNKTRETLLYDILDPNRAVEPRWNNYAATTTDGRSVTGLLASETPAALVLKRAEGKQDTLLRSEIDELESTGKSLMPEGIEKDVSVEEMRDLLEFLKQRR